MASKFEVSADKLAWHCDLSFLPFTCTADMTPLEDFIGQERAMRAIQFGLRVDKPGLNIFVAGERGADGRYPEGTINGRVENKLRQFAEQLRQLAPTASSTEMQREKFEEV